MDDPVNNKPPTFWQMLHSVMAAAFGVQSGKNRARDFTHGKPSHFVVLGILFTAVFALALFGIVKLVLLLTGGLAQQQLQAEGVTVGHRLADGRQCAEINSRCGPQ